jgi:hypothetical protein
MFAQMKHLKEKYKKLKHAIYDYEEVPEEVPEENPEVPEYEEERYEPQFTRRRTTRADYLNYSRFGF